MIKKSKLMTTIIILSLGTGLLATPGVTAQAMRVRAPRTFLRWRLKRHVSKHHHVKQHHNKKYSHRR